MILLSICIPTYNRSELLNETLESIVTQAAFRNGNEIEIVVSDNCSTDNTNELMSIFCGRFPNKIIYNRNHENISYDKNYEKVLSLANGKILKLNNDTLKHNDGCLNYMLSSIKLCKKDNTIPFFLNGEISNTFEPFVCSSSPQFVKEVSYWSTWIGSFAIPKLTFDNLNEFSNSSNQLLSQVDVLLRLLNSGNEIMVFPEKIFTLIPPSKKGGYNLFEVFLSKYFRILEPNFATKEEILILKNEKRKILRNFVINIYVSMKANDLFKFHSRGYRSIIIKEFNYLEYIRFKSISQYKIYSMMFLSFLKKLK